MRTKTLLLSGCSCALLPAITISSQRLIVIASQREILIIAVASSLVGIWSAALVLLFLPFEDGQYLLNEPYRLDSFGRHSY